MAWIFSLSAECGASFTTAEQFSGYFSQVSWVLSNGSQSQCSTRIYQDVEKNWWCRVSPSNISEIGINTPEDAQLMTEVGVLLYRCLRAAPAYRYALVGVEVDEFRTYSEFIEDFPNLKFPGLVLSQTLIQSVEITPLFRQFSPGYIWKPYEGEVYQPLNSIFRF